MTQSKPVIQLFDSAVVRQQNNETTIIQPNKGVYKETHPWRGTNGVLYTDHGIAADMNANSSMRGVCPYDIVEIITSWEKETKPAIRLFNEAVGVLRNGETTCFTPSNEGAQKAGYPWESGSGKTYTNSGRLLGDNYDTQYDVVRIMNSPTPIPTPAPRPLRPTAIPLEKMKIFKIYDGVQARLIDDSVITLHPVKGTAALYQHPYNWFGSNNRLYTDDGRNSLHKRTKHDIKHLIAPTNKPAPNVPVFSVDMLPLPTLDQGMIEYIGEKYQYPGNLKVQIDKAVFARAKERLKKWANVGEKEPVEVKKGYTLQVGYPTKLEPVEEVSCNTKEKNTRPHKWKKMDGSIVNDELTRYLDKMLDQMCKDMGIPKCIFAGVGGSPSTVSTTRSDLKMGTTSIPDPKTGEASMQSEQNTGTVDGMVNALADHKTQEFASKFLTDLQRFLEHYFKGISPGDSGIRDDIYAVLKKKVDTNGACHWVEPSLMPTLQAQYKRRILQELMITINDKMKDKDKS